MKLMELVQAYGVDNVRPIEILSDYLKLTPVKIEKIIGKRSLFELMSNPESFEGLSEERVSKIKILLNLVKTISKSKIKDGIKLDSSQKAKDLVEKTLRYEMLEKFLVIFLDTQNNIIKEEILFEGSVNETPVYPRVIVEKALKYNAASIIVAHNHPGGLLTPSSPDLASTKKIKKALESVDMRLLDHIITSKSGSISLTESGYI